MQFSERMAHIKPSATLTINAKALELKSQGVDVTSLAIGEPNFPTPAHVCDAAKQAIDEGFTRYTAVPGIPPLREAIAGYFKRAYGVDVAPDCTIASNGGKQSLYNLFAALLNDGDEVLIPSPYWVSYPDMVYLNGGVPVAVKAPASQGFKVTVEQLEAALTPKAKILVFNSPSNPTGACYSVSERDAIVKWALDRGLFIIADEIYDQLVYEPNKPSSIIVWWKQYPARIAVVGIGYADGFPRSLSSNVSFLLHGRRVPQVGRICMDMCMVDITRVPELMAYWPTPSTDRRSPRSASTVLLWVSII